MITSMPTVLARGDRLYDVVLNYPCEDTKTHPGAIGAKQMPMGLMDASQVGRAVQGWQAAHGAYHAHKGDLRPGEVCLITAEMDGHCVELYPALAQNTPVHFPA